MKTLKDLHGKTNDMVRAYDLRAFARSHIKYLRKQEKLHWEFVSHFVGEHPDGKVPKGFDKENSCGLPYGYEIVIRWIQKTFNLEVDKK